MILSAARYVITLMLLGDITPVIVGVFMLKEPKEIWGNDPLAVISVDGMSPAVMATILLRVTTMYVYFLVPVSQTILEIRGPSQFITKLRGTLVHASCTVNFSPMSIILCIETQMRALQIDPARGSPQRGAQMYFYVIIMPFCAECDCKECLPEGEVVVVMDSLTLAILFADTRQLALLTLCGGSPQCFALCQC